MDADYLSHRLSEDAQLHSTTESLSSHALLSAVIDETSAYLFRKWLKARNFEDSERTSRKIPPSSVAVAVNGNFLSSVVHDEPTPDNSYAIEGFNFSLQNIDLPLKSSKRATSGVALLVKALSCLVHPKFKWSGALKRDLPNSWERHGDLLLLPEQCFLRAEWKDLGDDLWKLVSSAFRCSRIARRGRITNNSFRSPAVALLRGSSGWVEHVDNKIRYRYDITKCMFSAGNITEKMRIARFNCEGETVVDLFAGIGYFTLPYLVHARANLVYACEWNPDAVEALKMNLTLNGVADRCTVLQGDNRQSCPKGVADRVNLGLIPSSEGSWETACAALRPELGGILHVHGNVTSQTQKPAQTNVMTTKSNTVQQTHATNKHANVTKTIGDDKTSSCVSSEFSEVKLSVVTGEEKKHDISCDTSNSEFPMQHEEINKACPISNDDHTTFRMLPDDVLSETTRNPSYAEICTKPEHEIGGAVAYQAVNHGLPANRSISADSRWNGKQSELKHPRRMKSEWVEWASRVSEKLAEILHLQTSGQWQTTVLHIEHVKSYAPRIDHIVADIRCTPAHREMANENKNSA